MGSLLKKFFLVGLIMMSGLIFSGCNPLERKNKAGLQVITNDIPVSIFINEEFLGKSPFLTKDLKPGEYSIKLEPEDPTLTSYETTINLNKGLLTVVTWKPGSTLTGSGGVIYELEKLTNKNQTELSIISIPDGAILGIDEGDKEFSPLIKNGIDVGSHEFEASLPSYETQNHTLNIVKGHRLNVLIKLAKENPNAPNVMPTPPANNEATDSTILTPESNLPPQPLRQATASATLANPKILIKTTGYFETGKEVLRVREASSSASKTLGYAESGMLYRYLEEKNKDWFKIEFKNKVGWVSSKYAEIK
jgi:hypothetical protein